MAKENTSYGGKEKKLKVYRISKLYWNDSLSTDTFLPLRKVYHFNSSPAIEVVWWL